MDDFVARDLQEWLRKFQLRHRNLEIDGPSSPFLSSKYLVDLWSCGITGSFLLGAAAYCALAGLRVSCFVLSIIVSVVIFFGVLHYGHFNPFADLLLVYCTAFGFFVVWLSIWRLFTSKVILLFEINGLLWKWRHFADPSSGWVKRVYRTMKNSLVLSAILLPAIYLPFWGFDFLDHSHGIFRTVYSLTVSVIYVIAIETLRHFSSRNFEVKLKALKVEADDAFDDFMRIYIMEDPDAFRIST